MCVPCAKELINNGATHAAEDAELMRQLVVGQAEKEERDLTPDEEAFLLSLATVEASFILSIGRCRREMIQVQGGSRAWVDLARMLEAGAGGAGSPSARPPSGINRGEGDPESGG